MEIKKNNDNHSNIEIKRKKSVKSNSKLSLLLDH